MKKALITGVSGQDGSYLSELLLTKGYQVHGTILPYEAESPDRYLWRLDSVRDDIKLYPVDIREGQVLAEIVKQVHPDECYHLAAISFVPRSFDDEFSVFEANLTGTHNLLASLQETNGACKVYFAGSSEMFGEVSTQPQDEETPFNPRSPYGITKATGFFLSKYYRKQYSMFVCNGIAYNHESPRRGVEYVTRKITHAAARIKLGLEEKLDLGNLDAKRDWGYSPDYVHAMWLMLQQDAPDDYVLATGVLHSVRDLCKEAFGFLDLDYRKYVNFEPKFYRPNEKVPLVGDASKAAERLNWRPTRKFDKIIEEMVHSDLNSVKNSR